MRIALSSSPVLFALFALAGCSSTTPGRGLPDGGSITSSESSSSHYNCNSFGSDCTCVYSSAVTSETVECSSASVKNGVCCADYGWPADNLHCRCEAYSCKQTGPSVSDCRCGPSVGGNLTSCSGKCCQTEYGCECGDDLVCTGTPVASCTAALQGCSSETKRVSACTAK